MPAPGINQYRTGSKKPRTVESYTYLVFLGPTQKGDVANLTPITSLDSYIEKFGKAIATGYTYQAVEKFYNEGGRGTIYIGRVVHYSDPSTASSKTSSAASVILKDRAGTAVDTLKIEALYDGTYANGMIITIADATVDATNKFKLIVKDTDSNVLETFDELSMDNTSSDYVEIRINGISKYIKVIDLDSATVAPNNRPAIVAGSPLAGGNDGLTGLTDNDYIGTATAKNGLYMCNSIASKRALISIPGNTSRNVIIAAQEYCAAAKNKFFVFEYPKSLTDAQRIDFKNGTGSYSGAALNSKYCAGYTPWYNSRNSYTLQNELMPVTPAVLAIYTKVEEVRGIHKAPAGVIDGYLVTGNGVEADVDMSLLNDLGINAIKNFEGYGVCVFGSRTTSIEEDWKDIPTSLIFMYIEDWIQQNFLRYCFEPINDTTFTAIETMGKQKFKDMYSKGQFDDGGTGKFEEACFFTCNYSNNTEATKEARKIIVDWGIRPLGVAEIIEFRSTVYAGSQL